MILSSRLSILSTLGGLWPPGLRTEFFDDLLITVPRFLKDMIKATSLFIYGASGRHD